MRLISAHVTNYRSVEDSDEFEVEPDVTCLVGKNESGKTAVLQAIYRSNPVESAKTFDEVIHFPARKTAQRKNWKPDQRVPVATLTLKLTGEEIADIESDLGSDALVSRVVTVTVGYRDDTKLYGLEIHEFSIVEHLRKLLDISLGTYPTVAEANTVEDLYQALVAISEPPGSVVKVKKKIDAWPNREAKWHIIDNYLEPALPTFVYFDDYDTMPGKVSIPDLILRSKTGDLKRGERALLSLLNMAQVRPEDFQSADQHAC